MATLKFIIRKSKVTKQGLTKINLRYCHASDKIELATNKSIEPQYWDTLKGRPKKKYPSYGELDEELDGIERKIKLIIKEANQNNIEPTAEYVKAKFLREDVVQKKERLEYDFLEIFQEYQQYLESNKAINTVKNFNSLHNNLVAYQKKKRVKIVFSMIDHRFYDSFVNFLIKQYDYAENTLDDRIKMLKTYLFWATERKYNKNEEFKTFKRRYQKVDIIYLTDRELNLLEGYEFSGEEKKNYELVRDTFCLCCYTGLRYSDLASLKSENIQKNHIIKRMQKTQDIIKIPIVAPAQAILDKYKSVDNGNYELKVFANPVMNRYLKEIGEIVGIDDKVTMTNKKRGVFVENTQPKYKFITCHTARRTFITLSLEKGIRPEVVMNIAGHKDFRTTQKYIKLVDNVIDDEVLNAWNK
jgi:integrase